MNLEEAGFILGANFITAYGAAKALHHAGVYRAVITDGSRVSVSHSPNGTHSAAPPKLDYARRITGAGDTFMAAHIAAEMGGFDEQTALNAACIAAADYVGSDGSDEN